MEFLVIFSQESESALSHVNFLFYLISLCDQVMHLVDGLVAMEYVSSEASEFIRNSLK